MEENLVGVYEAIKQKHRTPRSWRSIGAAIVLPELPESIVALAAEKGSTKLTVAARRVAENLKLSPDLPLTTLVMREENAHMRD